MFQAYKLSPESTLFVVDASPWGYGAVFIENHQIIEYKHDVISQDEIDILRVKVGSLDGQQVFEALAMSMALRVWRARWRQLRST